MKGVILAGGKGSRLYPATAVISKPLLPVYDKPMIYYPLSTLIRAGIDEIMVISSPGAVDMYRNLLGDGGRFGIRLIYGVQQKERGIADALIIAEEFIKNDPVCLILGDNIFLGAEFERLLAEEVSQHKSGARVFGYYVEDPAPFGVIEFDSERNVISIEEKPQHPKSNYIVPGIYFYDENAAEAAGRVEPSPRGELEITSVNNAYLENGSLKVSLIDREAAWFDAGTPENIRKAADFIADSQQKNGLTGSPELSAFRTGRISAEQLRALGAAMDKTAYGQYLQNCGRAED